MSEPLPTLDQRIQAIADETKGGISGTSRDRFDNPGAVGIEDVENALRPLFVEHGVLTYWGDEELDDLGNGRVWQIAATVLLVNVDDREDTRSFTMMDIGTSPTAARSFARREFYKSLLHWPARGDDEIHGDLNTSTRPRGGNNRSNAKVGDKAGAAPVGQVKYVGQQVEKAGFASFNTKDITVAECETIIAGIRADGINYTHPRLGNVPVNDEPPAPAEPAALPLDEAAPAPENKPVTQNQLSTIEKLSGLLGESFNRAAAEHDLTSTSAGKLINELTQRYNAQRGGTRGG